MRQDTNAWHFVIHGARLRAQSNIPFGRPHGQNWSKSTKIAPRTAEKRQNRFAHAIKHDEAHHPHAFDHRGPWYHQCIAIFAPTGPPIKGCSGPENASFFETAVGRISGIDANPLSACGMEHGLFLNMSPYPARPRFGSTQMHAERLSNAAGRAFRRFPRLQHWENRAILGQIGQIPQKRLRRRLRNGYKKWSKDEPEHTHRFAWWSAAAVPGSGPSR